MTDTPTTETDVESPVEPNGDRAWSVSEMTRGATERLIAINEKISALRTMRHQINGQIKSLVAERADIERLMRAVEKQPRKGKRHQEETLPGTDES